MNPSTVKKKPAKPKDEKPPEPTVSIELPLSALEAMIVSAVRDNEYDIRNTAFPFLKKRVLRLIGEKDGIFATMVDKTITEIIQGQLANVHSSLAIQTREAVNETIRKKVDETLKPELLQPLIDAALAKPEKVKKT